VQEKENVAKDTGNMFERGTMSQEEPEEEEVFETNWKESVEKFDDMGLREEVLRGIYGYGYKDPSPIQQKAILPVVQGKDTIAQAQSGTGKTGTFTIGILQSIDPSSQHTQALIVSPTRELSMQIAYVVHSIGEFMGVKVHACVGGTKVGDDIRALKHGAQVVVGTPGRVHDMMRRGFLKSDYLKLFTLDEADEML